MPFIFFGCVFIRQEPEYLMPSLTIIAGYLAEK